MFRAHFSDPLNAFLTANPKSIVIVVPSVRDMMSDHAAYPQPELDGSVFGNHSVSVPLSSLFARLLFTENPLLPKSLQVFYKWGQLRNNEHRRALPFEEGRIFQARSRDHPSESWTR